MSRCMNGPMGCDYPRCGCNSGLEAFEAWVRSLWDIGPTRPTDLQGNLWAAWRAARASAVPQWQPIETAPKGVKCLLWGEGRPFIGDWAEYAQYNQPNVTHWMPLPSPPKETT